MICHAGDWVRIHSILLPAEARAPGIPEETRAVPLEMRVKGWLLTPRAEPGDRVEIRSTLGRVHEGWLEALNPPYGHDFGAAIPELLQAGEDLRTIMQSLAEEAAP